MKGKYLYLLSVVIFSSFFLKDAKSGIISCQRTGSNISWSYPGTGNISLKANDPVGTIVGPIIPVDVTTILGSTCNFSRTTVDPKTKIHVLVTPQNPTSIGSSIAGATGPAARLEVPFFGENNPQFPIIYLASRSTLPYVSMGGRQGWYLGAGTYKKVGTNVTVNWDSPVGPSTQWFEIIQNERPDNFNGWDKWDGKGTVDLTYPSGVYNFYVFSESDDGVITVYHDAPSHVQPGVGSGSSFQYRACAYSPKNVTYTLNNVSVSSLNQSLNDGEIDRSSKMKLVPPVGFTCVGKSLVNITFKASSPVTSLDAQLVGRNELTDGAGGDVGIELTLDDNGGFIKKGDNEFVTPATENLMDYYRHDVHLSANYIRYGSNPVTGGVVKTTFTATLDYN